MIVPFRSSNSLRSLVLLLPVLSIVYILTLRVIPAFHHNVLSTAIHRKAVYPPTTYLDPNISVNLVIASQAKDDISWTKKLPIPNLNIIRYVSDDPNARYRPPILNKGREALMYHTYMYDFYDDLPDITIFTHSEEHPWHMDGVLQQSMSTALSRLNLTAVMERGYFNLKTGWKDACPAWINTTKTPDDWNEREEPFVAWAWSDNFRDDPPAPEIVAGPCCSQFAVTRDKIRSRDRSQYEWSQEWLKMSDWHDYFTGRVWEHMWPWLFLREAVDCVPEQESLCRFYGICFQDGETLAKWELMWEGRKNATESMSFVKEVWSPMVVKEQRLLVEELGRYLDLEMDDAIRRGSDEKVRTSLLTGATTIADDTVSGIGSDDAGMYPHIHNHAAGH
ncbi:hypothetical protein CLAFUW4_14772 [Fulvia fulva]|uniref:Uncharacterized protein n=1 Tax=Passalora fulva TaxID=5499 RepID=A0A9Q8PMR2_PASFU|nr:uncharacterized protein CLAFUR5_14600 [Fulvia fulva]KAK4608945.1 hypothetical protein CLAFUR4_14764 [Fulvia fulva]KAK4609800.1 hypothetical protein CLAFUR0_14764 [Fulvia fulva]UJO25273.1 hypothetical protein CLAFUR5_14600 [Fulvia fulva]WPV22444.1 hypothetical protein CLAFUW4_14772 [Fulvia fulva]WPV37362.1 hypothetical protein CLAFUW7_14773 [Fulvia fulva]